MRKVGKPEVAVRERKKGPWIRLIRKAEDTKTHTENPHINGLKAREMVC